MTEKEKKEIMSVEAFNELIRNLEYVESLTLYGKKSIKYNVEKLQKELEQKDKIIDEMVNSMVNAEIWIHLTKEEIKQYFEKKVEE